MLLSQNKVDVSAMTEQEQKAFKMYGKVPAKNLLTKMQKDRKYFDSGDYMMNKAGVQTDQILGSAIPTPAHVPHASPPTVGNGPLSSSPTRPGPSPGPNEHGSFLSTSDKKAAAGNGGNVGVGISPAATSEAVEVPGAAGHKRRGSESYPRVSPPGIMREGNPSSSFPIQHAHHPGTFGSSPVKTSNLGRRLDEEMEG
ncbi:hypothetical protein P7C73_g5005, partial [Tremellales sp. Uapishka_1]